MLLLLKMTKLMRTSGHESSNHRAFNCFLGPRSSFCAGRDLSDFYARKLRDHRANLIDADKREIKNDGSDSINNDGTDSMQPMIDRFRLWLAKFNRTYKDQNEWDFRFKVFQENVAAIDAYNAQNRCQNHTFVPSCASDRTSTECLLLRLMPPRPRITYKCVSALAYLIKEGKVVHASEEDEFRDRRALFQTNDEMWWYIKRRLPSWIKDNNCRPPGRRQFRGIVECLLGCKEI